MSRRKGQGVAEHEATVARVEAENKKADDWFAVCRHCGKGLSGTLAKLKEHQCEAATEQPKPA